MLKKLISRLAAWLIALSYERQTLDKVNGKLIELVPGLMVDGKPMYKYVNESDLPIQRKIALFAFNDWLNMRITPELVLEYLDKIRIANNEGDKSKVGLLAYTLEDITKNLTPRDAFYKMASVYYFFADEDTADYDGDLAEQKIASFRMLPDQRFFLRQLLTHVGISEKQSIDDILSSSNQSEVKLKVYRRQATDMGSSKP